MGQEFMYVYMYCYIKNEGFREGLKVLKNLMCSYLIIKFKVWVKVYNSCVSLN